MRDLLLAALLSTVAPVMGRPAAAAVAPRAGTGVSLATPVLSVRRIAPALVARRLEGRIAVAVQRVRADATLAPWVRSSCVVVEVGHRRVVDEAGDALFIPASTLKLTTAAAALKRLGADGRLRTEARAASAPRAGVITGDLVLIGGGDPLLTTDAAAALAPRQPVVRTRFEDLADAIAAAGVTRIDGGIVGDGSRFDDERTIPSWKASYVTMRQVGRIGALTVDDGFSAVGPAPDPAAFAAARLADLLKARGVAVAGPPRAGAAVAAQQTLIAKVDSPPVREIVGEMLRESDNTTAEMLLKELAHHASANEPGSWLRGTAEVKAALAEEGADVSSLRAVDGSGLDRSDRTSCAMLVHVLTRAGRSSAIWQGLAVAGETGTLAKRFVATSAAGRLHAKTGSLDGVSALAGFVEPASAAGADDAPEVRFAVISNDAPQDEARLTDRIGPALATAVDRIDLAAISPRSPTPTP